jgi:ribosomal protein L19
VILGLVTCHHTILNTTRETQTSSTTYSNNNIKNHSQSSNNTQERGDITLRGLFERGTNAIIDVRIANLDSPSYRSQDPEKVLQQQENAKRQKYKDICETRQESFHPVIASTDSMLAPEATKILQHLAHTTAKKTQKAYSAIVKHLRLSIAITLVKATHYYLRASRKKCHQPTSTFTPKPTYRTQSRIQHVKWSSNPAGHNNAYWSRINPINPPLKSRQTSAQVHHSFITSTYYYEYCSTYSSTSTSVVHTVQLTC